ncbi:MAG: SMI1/KNR4 family protein [Ilumatobacteraceae bacterium]
MRDLLGLGGHPLTTDDLREVEARLGVGLPDSVVRFLSAANVVGLTLTLDEDADESGLGVDLRWMTLEQTVSEGTESFPGIAAVPLGYLPVGIDLGGSGDPYFIRLVDGAFVRIPHDAVRDGRLLTEQVEVVSQSVEEFVERATPGR